MPTPPIQLTDTEKAVLDTEERAALRAYYRRAARLGIDIETENYHEAVRNSHAQAYQAETQARRYRDRGPA